MIIIETYTDAVDAYNAKALLESNGIHCELKNHLLSGEPLEKIELSVGEKDVKLARDVLANAMGENNH
ncbi:CBU_0469 family Dot/Icm T4SS effector [Coxiella burnetii]|uniref:DUF2007 domain-containing protein n=2 Tax=Coxiella burnetii TaxID=777 RepID=Q83E62_COXBU|nr:CBU_0469 family Dot/Icm T4SS effector [Coxiella burnetii]NP_819504.1 hypothetical protein CBU_0469 [Coxiella burnetii RSA 493]AAO90018.1 hypothetical protein CBU_0469 [Coxiella burnetii RSA 493]ABS77468.1 hypothetical protein CBUD_1609 [Coxiella burnetii Dugway 5J108-111]ABX78266.1 conserved hypothetical protein [Coxiella burnetii RSA 331]ACJ18838.1 hypothetical protein CbuG_1544 [Coxiella burnetii CbuG_Q212]ACJ20566.1 hypothetical protein CbuK_1391 [Coxiella burnetii CbuK_Q154]